MSEETKKKLTDKQRAFIDAYFACGFNATEAARRAGYKDPEQAGYENKKKQEISDEISRRMNEHAMPANEVLARLAAQARADMSDFLRTDEEEITLTWSLMEVPTTKDGKPDDRAARVDLAMQENVKPTDRVLHTATVKRSFARLDLLAAGQSGKLHLVKKYSTDGAKETIELYDAQAALVQIGKVHGLFTDRTEHSGTIGYVVDIGSDTTTDTPTPASE